MHILFRFAFMYQVARHVLLQQKLSNKKKILRDFYQNTNKYKQLFLLQPKTKPRWHTKKLA